MALTIIITDPEGLGPHAGDTQSGHGAPDACMNTCAHTHTHAHTHVSTYAPTDWVWDDVTCLPPQSLRLKVSWLQEL